MKPGRNDKPAYIKFTMEELKVLQENSYQMAEAYGLDRRIERLKGKRKVMFYSWDLDCLDSVFDKLEEEYTKQEDLQAIESIKHKIEVGYKEIKQQQKQY